MPPMHWGEPLKRGGVLGALALVLLAGAAAPRPAHADDYAYSNLTRSQEEALLREHFAAELKLIDADPARALADVSLLRVDSPTEALASLEGETVLLESEVPLRAPEEDGDLHKVELELEPAQGGGYEPANPLVDLTLPESADESIEIGDEGLAITPEGATPAIASKFGSEDLFLPSAREDTSFLLSPIAGGLEFSAMLLSPDSPERLSFGVNLPQGATLRASENGGAEVVGAEGEAVATVTAPHAVDAQGATIPVGLEVEGSSLVISFPHREAEIAYPLYVDPQVIEENWSGFADTSKLSYWHWSWSGVGAEDYIGKTSCIVTCWGNGLYVRSRSSFPYPGGSWGRWWFTPQGTTTYMRRVILGPINYDPHGCTANEPHPYVGVWNDSTGWKVLGNAYPSGWPTSIDTGEQNLGAGTRTAFVGIEAAKAANIGCGHDFRLGGATLFLDDPESPTVGAPSYPTGWIKSGATVSIGVPVSDPGLGAYAATLSPGGALPITKQQGCDGHYANPCPASYTFQFNVSSGSFDEGEKPVRASSEDGLRKGSNTYEWNLKVDRTPPQIDLAGQLAQATEETEGDAGDEKLYNALTLPVYNLEIKASDGSNESAATKRSGVKKIQVFLDNSATPLKTFEASSCAASSCPLNVTYALKLNELSADTHHYLRILATDFAGNMPRERKVEFEYIPATGMKDEYVMQYFPLPDGSGNEDEEEHPVRPELAVNLMNGNLAYRQRDVDVTGPGADLEVERFYNSLLPGLQNTEWGDGWTLAQNPVLEIQAPEGSGPANEAKVVEESGGVEGSVALPTSIGEKIFNKRLQATVIKAAGGYEVADESGESSQALAFAENGKVDELRTGSAATVDYSYEGGDLSEIAVEDPGTAQVDPAAIEHHEDLGPAISHTSDFGTLGSEPGQLKTPADVAVDPQGNLFVLDRGNNRVEKFGPGGQLLLKFGSAGSANGQLSGPTALALDAEGNVWVADYGNSRLQKFGPEGQYLAKFGTGGTGNGQFWELNGVAVAPDGSIWTSDAVSVQHFSSAGTYLGRLPSGSGTGQIKTPQSLAVDSAGNVYVADAGADRVSVFDKEGKFLRSFGSSGTGAGQFQNPTEVAVDSLGEVWVGDNQAGRVQLFSSAGDCVATFGSSGTGTGQFKLDQWMGIAADGAGRIWVSDSGGSRVEGWLGGNYQPSNEPALEGDDPAVEVNVTEGLVDSVEGEEAGAVDYSHSGQLLSAVSGPGGETTYAYDSAGRMTKVTLPNGTYGEIAYEAAYGRVKSVTVAVGGNNPKTTYFEYSDEPRRTVVTPADTPVTTYDFGADGSLLKWSNGKEPPTFDDIGGTLYDPANRETAAPIAAGDYNLVIQPHSEEGIAKVQVIANNDQLVDEMTCDQDPETPGIECRTPVDEWVTNTANWPPGIVYLEVIATDRLGQTASTRFWVNIPQTPPPDPEAEEPPTYEDILHFREEFGLDLDLKGNEVAINDRIFDLMGAWQNPNTPEGEVARATAQKWGVPLRTVDAAELEEREQALVQDAHIISQWGESQSPSFAGFYMDHRAGGKIRVGFTSNQSAQVAALKGSSGLLDADRITAFGSQPSWSSSELHETLDKINRAISENQSIRDEVTRRAIDIASNTVLVGAANPAVVGAFLAQKLGSSAKYIVTYDPLLPVRHSEKTPRERLLNNRLFAGDRVTPGCTLAFGAWEKQPPAKPSGEWLVANFALSEGHCWFNNAKVRSEGIQKNAGGELIHEAESGPFGTVRRKSTDVSVAGFETDAAAIRLDEGTEVPRWIYWSPGYQSMINGEEPWVPGMTLCLSGSATGTQCGPSSPELIETHYKGALANTWQIEIYRHGEGGDSGAPVWNPVTGGAVGLVTGGPDGGPTWFTPLLSLEGFPEVKPETAPGALGATTMQPRLRIVDCCKGS